MRTHNGVLAEGTVDQVVGQADTSPAHMWPESRHPGNQWLANIKGRRKHAITVMIAGQQARQDVRRMYRQAGYPVP